MLIPIYTLRRGKTKGMGKNSGRHRDYRAGERALNLSDSSRRGFQARPLMAEGGPLVGPEFRGAG